MHTLLRLPLRILVVALAFLAISSEPAVAQAQPLGFGPVAGFEDGVREKPYSAGIALSLPVAATALSVGLVGLGKSQNWDGASTAGYVGLALGPSLGHIYTGNWQGALIGTGLRVGGAGAGVVGVFMMFVGGPSAGVPFFIGGGIAAVGGTLYNIVDAPFSAVRANKKRQKKLERLSLSPAPIQGPSRSMGWGAQLQMTF
jgi:hypothetical protein